MPDAEMRSDIKEKILEMDRDVAMSIVVIENVVHLATKAESILSSEALDALADLMERMAKDAISYNSDTAAFFNAHAKYFRKMLLSASKQEKEIASVV